MDRHAAIVGAGIAGRLLALRLARAGWRVTVCDRDSREGRQSCTWTGAGMLAPYCELESRHREVFEMGVDSMAMWPALAASLDAPVFYQAAGSLIVAHPRDRQELRRLQRAVGERLPADVPDDAMQQLDAQAISELEPELAGRFNDGLYFPHEGQVDNRDLLRGLAASLDSAAVTWYSETEVTAIAPGAITLADGRRIQADWVCDCRGLGARQDLPDLRGVRGELVHVLAPEVQLSRPVRLMHPRYPIYIVPRADGRYVFGATQIESDDDGPITVRSALELLSAAYAVHSGFAEASIVDISVNCRPAFADNLPRLHIQDGLLRLNGLYRHGFLLSPVLTQAAVDLLQGASPPPSTTAVIHRG